jgi:hypothetical protein
MAVAPVPRGADLTLILSAMPSRGKKVLHQPDAAGAAGDRDGRGPQQGSFEAFDGAHIRLRRPGAYRHAEADARKIHVGAGSNQLCGDQLAQSFPGEDHHVGSDAAAELRGNGLRTRSLRGARAGRHLDAARAFEFRQQLLIRASEAAGNQDVQLRGRHLDRAPVGSAACAA